VCDICNALVMFSNCKRWTLWTYELMNLCTSRRVTWRFIKCLNCGRRVATPSEIRHIFSITFSKWTNSNTHVRPSHHVPYISNRLTLTQSAIWWSSGTTVFCFLRWQYRSCTKPHRQHDANYCRYYTVSEKKCHFIFACNSAKF